MFFSRHTPVSTLAEQATHSAEHAIDSGQRVAAAGLDSLSSNVQDIRHQASPMIERASERVSDLVHRGTSRVRGATHQLQERAHKVSNSTVNYVRDEPVKSVLIAAATGAALVAVASLVRRARARH